MHNPEMANDFHRHTSLLETFAVQLAFAAAGFASSFFRATERQAGGSNEVPGRDQRNARSLHHDKGATKTMTMTMTMTTREPFICGQPYKPLLL